MKTNKKDIIIYGAGGLGRETASLLRHESLREKWNCVGFVDDGFSPGHQVVGLPVFGGLEYLTSLESSNNTLAVVMAIGNTSLRRGLGQKLTACRPLEFPNIIHPTALIQDEARTGIGRGNLICAGSIFTTHIRIGSFNLVNLSCTLGHDLEMGNYCALMPGVHISGEVVIADEVLIGTGAVVLNGVGIGRGAVIGAGAVVTKDVPPDTTVTGVPAKVIRKEGKKS